MNEIQLLSDDQIERLKRELNFILWTDDSARAPAQTDTLTAPDGTKAQQTPAANNQCVAHALITAALLLRRGFTVATRCGAVFMIEKSSDGRRENDLFKQMPEHWWLTLAEHGVVDLSLRGARYARARCAYARARRERAHT